MFIIAKSDEYSWPVKVDSPKSGGTWQKMQFDAVFKRVRQTELKKMLADPESNDIDFARMVTVGWKGIQSEDKQDVPFSGETLEQLLEDPMVASAIVKAYLESVAGAPQKN